MSLKPGISVVIPTIGLGRRQLLRRAVRSVEAQTLPAADIIIEHDSARQGAGPTRNAGLARVETEWTAWLDDDDVLYPNHLETLMRVHEQTGASICWSWWEGNDVWQHECDQGLCPDRCHRHKDFDFEAPHLFGITYMVRTELAQKCSFPGPDKGPCGNEDYAFILQLRDLTEPKDWAHTPEATWRYNVHFANTSGQPWRW